MCGICVYAAATGATGIRAWLQTRRWAWLTRARLRRITVALVVAALAAATVSF